MTIKTVMAKFLRKKNIKPQQESETAGHRNAIISAVNKTVEIFTSHGGKSFDEVICGGLQPVAEAAGLNRIAVYRVLEKNTLRIGQIYVWAYGKTVPLDKELIELPKVEPVIRWLHILTKGEYVHGNAAEMSKDQADFCALFDVKAILFVPIFTHSQFWGIVTLEDHTNYRYFDEDCLDLLQATARLCANAFIRNEMAENANHAIEALVRRENLTSTLNQIAVKFLSQSEETFEKMMTAGVKQIVDISNIDRITVWRNFMMPDGLHSSQIYRWFGKTGGTTAPSDKFENASYSILVPRWEKILASNEVINSPVKLLPEADLLKSYGMLSIFVSPVFINNFFWGFVIFEDHKNERCFDDDMVEMMRSAAFLCVNTVIRADMEREIAGANERYRTILNVMPVGFTVISEHLEFIDCNDAIVNALGTTKEYLLQNFYEFSPEYQKNGIKSVDQIIVVCRRALEGEIFTFEWEHLSASGELIPFEITLSRVINRGKYNILAFQYDLSNLKKMERSLIEQSELLITRLEQQELLSEISRGFISSGDSETYIKEAIAKLGNYHNVSSVSIINIDYHKRSANSAYHWAGEKSLLQLNEINLFDMVQSSFPERLPDCSTLPVLSCDDIAESSIENYKQRLTDDVKAFIMAPLYVEGQLWGVLSVEQCLTPRQWTNNEKGFVAITASTIAGVIMRSIYNTMLKEALEKATIASKAKGEFLSNMSHEMRTPLNAIIGMTAIAKNADDMKRKDYALNKIEDASTHLLGVINDVLDMSKIEANKLELSSVEFNFEKLLQKTIAVINFRVEEKHQKLSVHIDKTIPEYLIGDDQRLAQVITNLLGNAVKFTSNNGSIRLDTCFKGEENGLCNIQISVTDSGIGISGEQKSRLFQSFQQAEASTVRKFGGTGLGLAISKNIVNMMGGKIWVESEEGKGSTFSFTILVKRGKGKTKHLYERSVNSGSIRILAIDDDPEILEFFKDISQRYKVHCDTAICGEDALRLVELNNNYNVYFIDWKMPDIDGVTLSSAIKSLERSPGNSVVILISAAEWTEIEAKAKKAGVDKFLSKPLFPSAVADTICECLGADSLIKDNALAEDASSFAGRCIMLAEDVEINREIVLAILEPTGLEIVCAENGLEAVKLFCQEPDRYDMIFMDVQMPEMDGYDATRNIRAFEAEQKESPSNGDAAQFAVQLAAQNAAKNKNRKNIPIIAMTANVFKEDIEKCMKAGMDEHLGKPLDFELVMEKLRFYLNS